MHFITPAPTSYGPRGLTFIQMALSQHQLDKAKNVIEFCLLYLLDLGRAVGQVLHPILFLLSLQSVQGSVNLSESRSSDDITRLYARIHLKAHLHAYY